MATSEKTALARTKLQADTSLRKQLLANTGGLDKVDLEGLYRLIGKADDALETLDEQAAKRGSQFSTLASRYDTGIAQGTGAAAIRGTVDLARLSVMAPIEFAKAAYLPDFQTLQVVQDATRGFGADANPKDQQVARAAWQTYLRAVKTGAAGNDLGTYREMVDRHGPMNASYFGPNDGDLADQAEGLRKAMDVAEQNAAVLDNAYQGIVGSWSRWVEEQRAKNPTFNPESDAAYDAFARDTKLDTSKLPMPSSQFIANIKKVAANPAEYPEVFSDIEASRKKWEDRRKDLESRLPRRGGEEMQPSVDDSFRAKMAAWVRRPDVQWWAKQNGYNLGTAVPVTPEIQAEIDAGRYPNSVLVNGMLYNPAPDDMRALRFAGRQLEMDPQKNLLYAAGLTRQQGPRRMVEVEVADEAAPRMTRLGVHDNGQVARLTDGSYVGSKDGETWLPIPAAAGEKLMGIASAEDVDEAVPGTKNKTRTVQLEYREPIYGRDPEGSIRGIDPSTGRAVVIPKEQIVQQTFLGTEQSTAGLAERINAGSAKRTAKRSGFDLSAEAQNEDIGEKPNPADVKARSEATDAARRVAKPVVDRARPEPDEQPVRGIEQFAETATEQFDRAQNADAAGDLAGAGARTGLLQTTPPKLTAPAKAGPGTAKPEDIMAPPRGPFNNTPVRQAKVGTTTGSEKEPAGMQTLEQRGAPPTATRVPAQVGPTPARTPLPLVTEKPRPTGTTTSTTVTPTESTTPEQLDAQRKVYQRTRGTGAAAGMVQ